MTGHNIRTRFTAASLKVSMKSRDLCVCGNDSRLGVFGAFSTPTAYNVHDAVHLARRTRLDCLTECSTYYMGVKCAGHLRYRAAQLATSFHT